MKGLNQTGAEKLRLCMNGNGFPGLGVAQAEQSLFLDALREAAMLRLEKLAIHVGVLSDCFLQKLLPVVSKLRVFSI